MPYLCKAQLMTGGITTPPTLVPADVTPGNTVRLGLCWRHIGNNQWLNLSFELSIRRVERVLVCTKGYLR